MRLVFPLVAAIALTACHRGPPPMPTQAFTAPGVTMKLDPPAAPHCKPDTLYRATLHWTYHSDLPKTNVRIGSPTGPLFARSNDENAHEETGDWVKPGTWFILLTRDDDQVLGALQAGPKPCP